MFLRGFIMNMWTASLHQGDSAFTIFLKYWYFTTKNLNTLFLFTCNTSWDEYSTEQTSSMIRNHHSISTYSICPDALAALPITTLHNWNRLGIESCGRAYISKSYDPPKTGFLNIPPRKLKPTLFPWESFLSFNSKLESKDVDSNCHLCLLLKAHEM